MCLRYVFPGMGANSRMFQDTWRELPNTTFIDWPEYQGEKTLRELAQRIIEEYKIKPESEIIGTSLGGMVGLEVAAQVNAHKVFLVGSAKSSGEINDVLHFIKPLIHLLPLEFLQRISGHLENPVSTMFSEGEAAFIKQMCLCALRWEGRKFNDEKIYRVHGRKDRIIPPPQDVDCLLDGGHLISITHHREVTSLIKKQSR